MSEQHAKTPDGNLLIYRADEAAAPIRVLLEGETVWLTQKLLAALYQVGVNTINHHIKGIYADGELAPRARIRKYRIVQPEGSRQVERLVDHYNLEMIIAIVYREEERETNRFFATMQNKMHFAATGLTAAEIVRQRADASKANMGATSWKGRQVQKRDVGTAKNYLDSQEIDTLNRITVMFLDQAEFRAQRRQDIRMADWEVFLDKFLHNTELPVLEGAGSIRHQDAIEHANRQYDAFAERRRSQAEAEAEARYIDDLKASAKLLGAERRQPGKRAGRKGKNDGDES